LWQSSRTSEWLVLLLNDPFKKIRDLFITHYSLKRLQ
jgi:hypothetical protein